MLEPFCFFLQHTSCSLTLHICLARGLSNKPAGLAMKRNLLPHGFGPANPRFIPVLFSYSFLNFDPHLLLLLCLPSDNIFDAFSSSLSFRTSDPGPPSGCSSPFPTTVSYVPSFSVAGRVHSAFVFSSSTPVESCLYTHTSIGGFCSQFLAPRKRNPPRGDSNSRN